MKKVFIIGFVWPEPETTAAGLRMVQLIEALNSFGWAVSFASAATQTEYSLDLAGLKVKTETIQLNHSSFDAYVKNLQPDYVIFDRFMVEEQFGWRVAEQVPYALRILNTEDLHSLRKTREVYHKKGEEFTVELWKQADLTKREIASIYRSDLSLMVSTFEMRMLQEEVRIPNNLLMHLPFMMEEISTSTQNNWPTYEERTDFVTYGNGKHTPNVDAITFLKQSIWPKIREKIPTAHLKIYGAYLPQNIEHMHSPKEGFHVLGWVKDLDEAIQQARVVLAPLRFGAGIKGKITEALKNGTPVVTTKVGAEGMQLDALPKECTSTVNPDKFAEAAVRMYSNPIVWETIQEKGVELINTQYGRDKHQKQLLTKLEGLSQNLMNHRSQNFIGSLLQHQSHAATKYMSKWIETKNDK